MAQTIPIKIRGKTLHVTPGTKSDIARYLLDEGYTVNEISKAVPMAYSQVHQIAKKDQAIEVKARASVVPRRGDPEAGTGWGELPAKGRKSTKPAKLKTSPRVGKLRTPGLPSDIDVGVCANCGHDLAVTSGGSTGYLIKHVNITAEEHLAVTQFCNATPKVLLS